MGQTRGCARPLKPRPRRLENLTGRSGNAVNQKLRRADIGRRHGIGRVHIGESSSVRTREGAVKSRGRHRPDDVDSR